MLFFRPSLLLASAVMVLSGGLAFAQSNLEAEAADAFDITKTFPEDAHPAPKAEPLKADIKEEPKKEEPKKEASPAAPAASPAPAPAAEAKPAEKPAEKTEEAPKAK